MTTTRFSSPQLPLSRILQVLNIYTSSFLLAFGIWIFSAHPQAIAQDGFTPNNRIIIHGGVNLPVGSFATLPSSLQELVPQVGKSPLGAANLGFTLGLSDVFRFTPNFGFLISLDGAYNPYNTLEAERQLRAGLSNLSVGGVSIGAASSLFNIAYTAQPYINGTLMGGIRYELPIVAGALSLYASAQGGVMYAVLPATEAKVSISVPLTTIRAEGTISQTAAQAAGLAYGLGAGVIIADRVNIGARFTASSPEFVTTIKPTLNASGIPGTVNVPLLGQVNIESLLNSAVGIVAPQTNSRFAFPINTLQVTVGVML